jgi:hypothetical protein
VRARLILLVGFLWTVHALMVACGGPAFTTGSGSGGVGGAGLDAAATCDADLLRDGLHCGRCGHDCLGGACQNGRCLPVAIATGQNSPLGVAVDKDYVYFANVDTSEIRRISKDGGGVDVLVQRPRFFPAYLAADVTDSTLYFTFTEYYVNGVSNGKVDSCLLPACTNRQTLLSDLTGPLGIAVDTNSIYVVVNREQILRRDKYGGPPTPIWTNDGGLVGLDVDTRYVYVAAQYSGTIFRVNAAADAGAEVVASQIPGVMSVAVDGQGLYFAVPKAPDGYVGVVPKAPGGGPPRVVVGGLARPTGVAVDARAIYFTTTNDGKVWRLAK